MKIEPSELSNIIEQNYSHLMPDFFKMQTEYLTSINVIYGDLDASLVAMVITNQLCKKTLKINNNLDNISFKYFYEKVNFQLQVSTLKIKDVSSTLNLPRETVRRKKLKLIEDNIITFDEKNKLYILNASKIDKKVLDIQIYNVSKILSKFSVFLTNNKSFIEEISPEQIKKDIDEKFFIYLTKFLDFQIAYFSNLKNIMDIESVFIFILCALNTLSSKEFKKKKPLSIKNLFYRLHMLNGGIGLNATSISEITKIPRTTVLRKIVDLEKAGMLKKDKFKRYAPNVLSSSKESKKLLPAMGYTLELLGIFFSQCYEIYSAKI
jgi:hypothetical protein